MPDDTPQPDMPPGVKALRYNRERNCIEAEMIERPGEWVYYAHVPVPVEPPPDAPDKQSER